MTAALIIATGKTNHKDGFSPERQIGRITAIERIALLFKLAGIQRIVVVGDEKELPQKLVPSMNLIFLTASANGEMLDSIRQGLLYLQDKCSETLISHVNVPMFSKETIQLLLDGSGNVCIPSYRGHCGHPILLREALFKDIIAYHGDNGLKGAIEVSGIHPQIIETDDIGILEEGAFDTSYANLLDTHDIKKLRASFQIKISKEIVFYGPGVHQLLQLIDEFGSLSNACRHMGISYTKGRKIISTMEDQLGEPVLETRQGGKTGGYSYLTEAAKKIMYQYNAFFEEADAALQEIFAKHFSSFDK